MNSRLKCHRLAWVVASGFTLTFQREVGYQRSWRPTGRLTSGVQRNRVRAGSSSTGPMTGSRRTAIQQMEAPIPRPTRPWFRYVAGAFTQLLVDLHADPFERAEDEAADYSHWRIDRIYLLVPALAFVGQCLQSFRAFRPRQKPASFSLDQVMQRLTSPQNGDN